MIPTLTFGRTGHASTRTIFTQVSMGMLAVFSTKW